MAKKSVGRRTVKQASPIPGHKTVGDRQQNAMDAENERQIAAMEKMAGVPRGKRRRG